MASGSLIDHFAVSGQLYGNIMKVKIIESGANLSDHRPLTCELFVHGFESAGTKCAGNMSRSDTYSFRWDKADLSQFYQQSMVWLYDIYVSIAEVNFEALDREMISVYINNIYCK